MGLHRLGRADDALPVWPGKPGTLLCRAPLRTRTCPFPSIRLKQAGEGPVAAAPYDSLAGASVPSVGPFAAMFVAASNLSVGTGVIVVVFSLAHLTASARFRVRAPGPYPASYPRQPVWRGWSIASRFPVVFRPPAFASRPSDSRQGIGLSLRSAYRTRGRARTLTGLPRSARMSYDRGGCPLYPEDGGARPGQVVSLTGACRFSAASPCILANNIRRRGLLDEASTGVHAHHANAKLVFRVSIVRDASDSGLYRMVEHSRRARRLLPRRDT